MIAAGAGAPRTMFAKIWSRHHILEREDGQVLLYVDRHFIHDVTAVRSRRCGAEDWHRVAPNVRSAHPITTFRPTAVN